ncbi:MAG: type II secretion system protein GspM [Pseudomonadota bacterium]
MSWLAANRRTAWVCGLTLLLPGLLYCYALFSLASARAEYQADIESLEPRIARLRGLLNHEAQLREASGRATVQAGNLLYPSTMDAATLATTLQTGARGIFTEAGMTVRNSQVLPVREQGSFDTIAVRLTVAGDLDSLDAALAELADFSPLLLVESIDVRPTRERTGAEAAQSLTATLQLFSLREAG